ncbi:MAG: phage tail tube protein [Pseudonocardiaceae bacterium]
MAVGKINSRDWVFVISDGLATPTWVQIGGINEHKLSLSENEETADTTDYASQGNYEGQVMQRGGKLEIIGFQLLDDVTAAPDPGQGMVETVGTLVGTGSLRQIRFRHVLMATWKVWTAFVSLGEQGGNHNAKGSWSATFTRSGASSTMAV